MARDYENYSKDALIVHIHELEKQLKNKRMDSERKGIPAHKIGKQWKFKCSELDAWVKSGKSALD